MNFKFKSLSLLISISLLVLTNNISSGLENHGTMDFRNGDFNGPVNNQGELLGQIHNYECKDTYFNNDGKIDVTESIDIQCQKFNGVKGHIKAPKITIWTETFNYVGKIECSQECTIYSKKPFDQKKFKRLGKGKFTIKIDPKLVMPCEKSYYELQLDEVIKKYKCTNTSTICRLLIQFNCKTKESQEWKSFIDKYKESCILIDKINSEGGLQIFISSLVNLYNQDIDKNIECTVSMKKFNHSNFNTANDNVLKIYCDLVFYFIYDPTNSETKYLDLLLQEKKMTYLESLQLFCNARNNYNTLSIRDIYFNYQKVYLS